MRPYTPSPLVLQRYADVLVKFALGGGAGIKKGEVVYALVPEAAKALLIPLKRAVMEAGGHLILQYQPDDSPEYNYSEAFYRYAQEHHLDFFPKKYYKGLIDNADHYLRIEAETHPHALAKVDPRKILRRGQAMKPYMDWRQKKEHQGKLTWTIGLYGTPQMAQEAGLSPKAYWEQIIKACFLDQKDPIKKWKEVYKEVEVYRTRLNNLSPRIDRLHIKGPDEDLWVTLGQKRAWMAGSGRNIPSFEIFTSPDWRGTEGWVRFNQPLYRYGTKATGIELWFKKGRVVKCRAKTGQKMVEQMIKTPNADKIGEFSLTDKHHSRITKFMATTLFDENMGGPQGNTHLALGASYPDCYAGDVRKVTPAMRAKLGYNDSSVHTDMISTARRTVTAHLTDGTQQVIYDHGQFVL